MGLGQSQSIDLNLDRKQKGLQFVLYLTPFSQHLWFSRVTWEFLLPHRLVPCLKSPSPLLWRFLIKIWQWEGSAASRKASQHEIHLGEDEFPDKASQKPDFSVAAIFLCIEALVECRCTQSKERNEVLEGLLLRAPAITATVITRCVKPFYSLLPTISSPWPMVL